MRIADCSLDTLYGPFTFHCFNFGDHEDQTVLCLSYPNTSIDNPLVRIQSACFTAEIFRSKDCDCHEQLEESLKLIQNEKCGYFIYLLQDGRGAGIFNKVNGLKLGETKNLDTSDAYNYLGLEQDPRKYSQVLEVIKYFKINKMRLLTNNPRKIKGIQEGGIEVLRIPLVIKPTKDSIPYLLTKQNKMGHMLDIKRKT